MYNGDHRMTEGWQCPKCSRCYAPTTPACQACNDAVMVAHMYGSVDEHANILGRPEVQAIDTRTPTALMAKNLAEDATERTGPIDTSAPPDNTVEATCIHGLERGACQSCALDNTA